jgi:ribosomal protein S18 acetylase RimI-like enzyme
MSPDPGGVVIRRGTTADAGRVSALLIALSEEFIVGEFTPEGRAHFLGAHSPAEVRQRLGGDYRFYLAEDGRDLVGVAALQANRHLYYLFVARSHQGRGLARRLWSLARNDSIARGNAGTITVNASNHAVAAYERLGFRRTGPMRERDGVLYNPMRFVGSG